LICTDSPVRGFRPTRAGRFLTSKLPKPAIEIFSPLARAAVMASKQVIDTATSNREAFRQEVEANQGLRKSEEHQERFRAAAKRVTGGK